jgi:competence protein ComGC
MSTETSLTILVIILSVTLAVFLILGIALLIKLINLTNSVQRIATKGEEIADRAEAAAEMFQNAAAPVAIGRVLTNIFDAVSKKRGK